jgi:hypothetical protein
MFTEIKQDILCRTHNAYFPLTDCQSYKLFDVAIIYIDIENLYPKNEIRYSFICIKFLGHSLIVSNVYIIKKFVIVDWWTIMFRL